jgi:hypothetical protein
MQEEDVCTKTKRAGDKLRLSFIHWNRTATEIEQLRSCCKLLLAFADDVILQVSRNNRVLG